MQLKRVNNKEYQGSVKQCQRSVVGQVAHVQHIVLSFICVVCALILGLHCSMNIPEARFFERVKRNFYTFAFYFFCCQVIRNPLDMSLTQRQALEVGLNWGGGGGGVTVQSYMYTMWFKFFFGLKILRPV